MGNASSEVLDFWLGPEAGRDEPAPQLRARWWKKDPTFDREIEATFGEVMAAAGAGELDAWAQDPRGRLALVILLDQFTRNVFRNSGKMYQYDAKALSLALSGIDAGQDAGLRLSERYFLYMPLMHAERLECQERCVALFEGISRAAEWCAGAVGYARSHRDIVARFGRFPHRNALLDRSSTEEELAFLREPGSSF